MLPTTTASLFGFLVIVTPGFVFQLWREQHVPRARQTTFREVSAVAVASVVFSGAALGLLALVRAWWPGLMPDVSAWIRDSHGYLHEHWRLVVVFVLVEVALASALALLAAQFLPVPGGSGSLIYRTAWWQAFRVVESDKSNYVCVRLKNAAEYFGTVELYTPQDCAPQERELTLIQPGLAYRATPDVEAVLLNTQNRVILSGADIESITVKYLERAAKGA